MMAVSPFLCLPLHRNEIIGAPLLVETIISKVKQIEAELHTEVISPLSKMRIMNLNRTVRTLVFSALLAATSLPVVGQDLLARIAPTDRKLKQLDTLALQSTIERENLEMPSSHLYADFDVRTTHYKGSALPETYRIDLRNYCMPTPSRVITSQFGPRWGRQHRGLDIKVYIGDTIRAAWSGKVRIVKYEGKGYGNYVVIRHANGLETYYAHLSKHLVRENQTVRAGEPIGLGGNTGRSTGSHLHFETRLCGVALNPAIFFDFRKQDITGDFYTFHRSTMERESARATAARGLKQNSYTKEEVYGGRSNHNQNQSNNTTAQRTESTPAPAPVVRSTGFKYHTVREGDTVQSLARRYNMSVEDFSRLNGLNPNSKLRAGQMLVYS